MAIPNDNSGWVPVGTITIELDAENKGTIYTYVEDSLEGNGWAFIWGSADNHIEVCEVSEGPYGQQCFSHRDVIGWGDEYDHPDLSELSRIPYIASTWIMENAAEAE